MKTWLTTQTLNGSRKLACGSAALCFALVSSMLVLGTRSVLAQSQPAPTQTIIKVGDECTMRPAARQGIVKIDACGRFYCGRTDVKDIIEVRPKIAAELGCEWQLVNQRCRCVQNFSRAPAR